ncbi:hypothetical protein ABZ894_08540 [Nocardia beijingensis]|uniref:hypothetical protein n=1 Tax=Nocardia beijingensis TaxID=95162 RepID=UPI0033C90715
MRIRAFLRLERASSCGIEFRRAVAGRTDRGTFGHSNDNPNSAAPAEPAILSEFIKASPYPESRCDTRQTEESSSHPIPFSVTANFRQPEPAVRRVREFASGPSRFTRADRQLGQPAAGGVSPANPLHAHAPARAVRPCKTKHIASQHD